MTLNKTQVRLKRVALDLDDSDIDLLKAIAKKIKRARHTNRNVKQIASSQRRNQPQGGHALLIKDQ